MSRGYEVGAPVKLLQSVGINVTLAEFPEAQTQLLILKSNEVREEISAQLGKDIEVKVPENWETPVTFTCNQPVKQDCIEAIDAYVNKASELRRSAIATGLENLTSLLTETEKTTPGTITPSQLATLGALRNNLSVPFALVDSFEQEIGSTVNNVQRPTYLMGIAAGLLIGLLILLQLTYTDSRVRSVRQLVRIVGSDRYLGRVTSQADAVRDRRIALSLLHGLNAESASRFRYMPLRNVVKDDSVLERLTEMTGATRVVTAPFADLSVAEISDSSRNEVDVIIVQRNRDLRKDVVEALFALQRSGRKFAGVLLVS